MDTEKCKVLLSVLRTGSFSKAGEEMGYTPSGVSRMMSAMEEEAGFPLLVRMNKGVKATKMCEEILPIIKKLSETGTLMQEKSAEIRGIQVGTVTVGTAYNSFYQLFAKIIADFTKIYPRIKINIEEGTSSELCEKVADGNLDLCVVSKRKANVEWIPLMEDELKAWVPKEHKAVRAGCFDLKNLEEENFIEIYPGQETDNSRVLEKEKIHVASKYGTWDTYAAYIMVEAGLGVTFVNGLFTDVWKGEVESLPLRPPQKVEIGIALPRGKSLSPAANRFFGFLEERWE